MIRRKGRRYFDGHDIRCKHNVQAWLAWAILHDSHGVILDTLCWCPEGEGPDTDDNWVRLSWLDSVPEINLLGERGIK